MAEPAAAVAALPGLLIYGLLLWAFATSLGPGRVPLVVQLAGKARGERLHPAVRRYAHGVTIFWATYFACAWLAVLATVLVAGGRWAFLLGVVAGLPTSLVLLLGEYGLRRIVLRDHPHMSFLDFLRFLVSRESRALLGSGLRWTGGGRHDGG